MAVLPAFYRNTLSTLPHHAFDVLISRRRVLGIDSMLLNDPEGLVHFVRSQSKWLLLIVVAFAALYVFSMWLSKRKSE